MYTKNAVKMYLKKNSSSSSSSSSFFFLFFLNFLVKMSKNEIKKQVIYYLYVCYWPGLLEDCSSRRGIASRSLSRGFGFSSLLVKMMMLEEEETTFTTYKTPLKCNSLLFVLLLLFFKY